MANEVTTARPSGAKNGRASGVLEPLAKPAAYELVVDRLRRAIHLASYIPGDRLPPERTLANQLGVSRVTVREALRVLQGEGYLKTRSGGASTVQAVSVSARQFRQQLKQRWRELDALVTFRLAIECAAAKLAAGNRDRSDIRHIDATLTRLEACHNLAEFRREDSAFHLAVATAARNPFLRDAIEDARAAMFWWIDALENKLDVSASVRDHREIADAIRDGRGDAASRAMSMHIEGTRNALRLSLDGNKG